MLLTIVMLALNLLFASSMIYIAEWTKTNHFGLFNFFNTDLWIKLFAGVLILDFWAAYVIPIGH